MLNNNEKNILNLAIEALKKNVDLPINIEIKEKELVYNNTRFDRLLKFKIKKIELLFCAEIKTVINKTTIGFLMHQRDYLPHPQILIAKYINTITAEELRKNAIQFIDTAGNIYR
ncbi:MAG: hypothetical protein ISS13_02945 [Actinobacteria bacterium]|nr:hypothetical protein [Actinomycetota bacterium]MBL7060776.1 hypothetical protein [Actinomycetota bacterium]